MKDIDLDALMEGDLVISSSHSEMKTDNFFDITKSEVTPKHISMLAPYLAAIQEMENVNEVTAPGLLAKLSKGLELTSSALASSTFHYNRTRSNLKKIQGIFFLERFSKYVAEQEALGNKVKETDTSKEHFVNTREEVIAAAAEMSYHEAVREQLSGMKTAFTMAISSAKSIVYSKTNSDSLSGYAN